MRKTPFFLLMAMMAFIAQAADTNPDFSGAWTIDPRHSDVSYGASGIGFVDLSKKITVSGPISVNTGEAPKPAKPLPKIQLIEQLTLSIVQSSAEMKVERKFISSGAEQNVIQTFNLDGSQSINRASDGEGELETRSGWQKGKLIHTGIQTIPSEFGRDETSIKEEYSLSKDGKTLTIKTTRVFPSTMVKTKQVFLRTEKK